MTVDRGYAAGRAAAPAAPAQEPVAFIAQDGKLYDLNEWRPENCTPLYAAPAPAVASVPLKAMDRGWYFHTDEIYIDVEREQDGRLTIFVRDPKSGKETFFDPATAADPCAPQMFSSAACSRGTKGCEVDHAAPAVAAQATTHEPPTLRNDLKSFSEMQEIHDRNSASQVAAQGDELPPWPSFPTPDVVCHGHGPHGYSRRQVEALMTAYARAALAGRRK